MIIGYDWQSGRLDPSIVNVKENELLPHLVQVHFLLSSFHDHLICQFIRTYIFGGRMHLKIDIFYISILKKVTFN